MAEGHYCSIHNTVFFKRGKMRGYAHPIKGADGEDTGEWCNEADLEKLASLPPQPSDKVLPQHQKVIDKAKREVSNPRETSIEQQVAIKEIGEGWRAGKLSDSDPLVLGYQAWLIDRLNYEEAKGEITKDNKADKATPQQKEGASAEPNSGEALELLPGETERVGKFFKWIMSKDENITQPRLWLATEYAVDPSEALSDAKCEALYKTIKKKKRW